MIGNRSGVDDLDARRIVLEMADAAAKAAGKALRELAKEQQKLIDSGQKPDGSRQVQNAKSTTQQKRGKPPLHKTGRLRDPKTWRLKRDKSEGTVTIRPPKDREAAVAILHAKWQYETVFHQLPQDFEKRAQRLIDEEMAKVKT